MSKVLIFTTSEGHISIANAINEYLLEHEIESQVVFFPEPIMNIYKLFYRYNPGFFRFFFRVFFNSLFDIWLTFFLQLQHNRNILTLLKAHQPTVVINTSFGFSPTLTHFHRQFGYYFVNVLPNPRTFFPQDLAIGADINIVFDEHQQQLCTQLKSQAKTKVLGWFVRGKFEQKKSAKSARQELGLQPNARTILVASGSEGVYDIVKVVSGLTDKELPPTTIIVACGSNRLLKRSIQRVAAKRNSSQLQILALSFTDQLPLYMAAADLVVGKAGPNTLFESTASHRPFVATTYINGQENGNLDIIKEYKLGFVALRPETAIKLLTELLHHPEKTTELQSSLETMAHKNHQAKVQLLSLIKPHLQAD